MHAQRSLPRRSTRAHVVAGAAAFFVTFGVLAGVTRLFQSDGLPLEQLVVAERACAEHAYVSERQVCMRLFVAAARVRNIASR